jgi:ribosomal protein L37AE/L43A
MRNYHQPSETARLRGTKIGNQAHIKGYCQVCGSPIQAKKEGDDGVLLCMACYARLKGGV